MLPQLGTVVQNGVNQAEMLSNQPAAMSNTKLNQINSMIGSRLGNIGSPSLALQAGMFKAFGNNVMTQGASQLGGVFSDLINKLTSKRTGDADQEEFQSSEDPRRSGLATEDRSILKEMLKSLLRIDKNTENIGSVATISPQKEQTKHKKTLDKIDTIVNNKSSTIDPIVGPSIPLLPPATPQRSDVRKSARDLLDRLDNKVPSPAKPRQAEHSNFRERMHNIGGNLESQAMQGVYSAFGYNTFTQSINEGVGYLGDTLSDVVTKTGKKTKDNPTGDLALERILANPKTNNGSGVSEDVPVVEEIKKSETILEKMLASLNSMNDMFKKFFMDPSKISTQESDLESNKTSVKPIKENGQYILPATGAILGNEGGFDPTSLIPPIGIDLPNGRKPPIPGKGTPKPGLFSKLKGIVKGFALPAVIAGAAGAAVDAGLGIAGVGKDDEGKDLVLDTKQDDANWEKMSTWEKMQSSAARGIEKAGSFMFLGNIANEAAKDRIKNETEYLNKKDLAVQKPKALSETLNKQNEQTESAKEVKQTNNVVNNTSVNNQTILPTRQTTRNTDSTASRYFDRILA